MTLRGWSVLTRIAAIAVALLVLAPVASARQAESRSVAAPAPVVLSQLPAEARNTIAAIRRGGPYAYDRDGVVFGNFERLLPSHERGYYREYTVPTPGVSHRGARRIIAGRSGELYYTDDHYRSFRRIRE